jgi:regulator of protease activity HflC (stomatin/prohibitin superfamily)
MKRWLLIIGWLFGLRFAKDNHVIPIVRMGRYHRVAGPGFFWINILVDTTLPPVKTSLYVGNFVFDEILSKEGIPFRIHLTVLFTFDPRKALTNVAAALVRAEDGLLEIIVKDYTNQGLRRLASRFNAEELWSEAMITVERDLTHLLTAEMRALGIAPLRTGGVLIKELFVPEKFQRAILNARQLQAILYALAPYPVPDLIEQAIRAVFTTNLEGQELTLLLSALSPGELAEPSYVLDVHNLLKQNGRRLFGG